MIANVHERTDEGSRAPAKFDHGVARRCVQASSSARRRDVEVDEHLDGRLPPSLSMPRGLHLAPELLQRDDTAGSSRLPATASAIRFIASVFGLDEYLNENMRVKVYPALSEIIV